MKTTPSWRNSSLIQIIAVLLICAGAMEAQPIPINTNSHRILDQWTETMGVGTNAVTLRKYKVESKGSGLTKVLVADKQNRLLSSNALAEIERGRSTSKIHPRLRQQFAELPAEARAGADRVTAIVWFAQPNGVRKTIERLSYPEDEPAKVSRKSARPETPQDIQQKLAEVKAADKKNAAKRAQIAELTLRATESHIHRLKLPEDRILYRFHFAPAIAVQLTLEECEELEKSDLVNYIFRDEEMKPEMNVIGPASKGPTAWSLGHNGTGVTIAHIEPDDDVQGGRIETANPYLSATVYRPAGPVGYHATYVAGIIASTHETVRGIAHGCNLLSANAASSNETHMAAATDWALALGASIINISWGFGNSADGALNWSDIYYDYVVHDARVLFTKSAGNEGDDTGVVTSPGRGYNSLAVGNVDGNKTLDWSDDTIHPESSYVDPVTGGDKPEIAAYGTHVGSTRVYSDWIASHGEVASGTSLSAPLVSAIAGLCVGKDPALSDEPATLKAMVMASGFAHNIEGAAQMSDKDGAGCAVATAVNADSYSATLTQSSFDVTDFWEVPVDIPFTNGEPMRVVLAYTHPPSSQSAAPDPSSYYKSDLDLHLFNSGDAEVASSAYDSRNAFEIIDYTPSVTGTGRVKIKKSSWNVSISNLRIGVAWASQSKLETYPDDQYERNNSISNAYPIEVGYFYPYNEFYHALQADEDWYMVSVYDPDLQVLDVRCTFEHEDGNIDLELVDASGTVLARADSTTDNERIIYRVPTFGNYYIRVYGDDAVTPYGLWCTGDPDDAYEDNDTAGGAYDLPERTWLSSIAGLGVQEDLDYYTIDFSPTTEKGRIVVDCRFTHADGDIDLGLYNMSSNMYVTRADSITDNEYIDYEVTSPGPYCVLVHSKVHPFPGNTYDLWWDSWILAVVQNTNDSGPGSLRQVVAYASSGTTITFTNTLSGQTIGLTSGQITVTNNLVIDASSLPGGIRIDGNARSRIFEFASGTTNVLTGLTLTNGHASGSSPDSDGGAIYLNPDAALTINDSTLSGNSASEVGGGIINIDGTLTINNSTLNGNTATNTYGYGGGIYSYAGTLTINNCTFSSNSAHNGGGIFSYLGTQTLNNASLSGNSADISGGGIFNGGTLTLTNTIVAGNTAPGGPDIYYGSFAGTNNLTSGDPMLAPLGDYGGPTQTMPPLPGSPAIDAGLDTGSLPTTDQRGFARVVNGTVDIGAVEFQGALDATLAVNPTSLTPTCVQGTNAPSESFAVWNSGQAALGYTVSESISWLSCTPTNSVSTGETNVITVNYTTAGLTPGIYTGFITVTATGAAGSPKVVVVRVRVTTSSFVVLNTNDSGPGSLREAMTLTSPGGIITFTNTLFRKTILLTSGQILVDKNLSIDASSLAGGIHIDGNARSRIFEFASGTTNTLKALTLIHGSEPEGNGGAIRVNRDADLTLNECTISINDAQYGGGIRNYYGTLTINDSTLSGNSATDSGGGIYSYQGTLTINNSTLTGNTASSFWYGSGGGIYGSYGRLTLNNSILSGNSAHLYGGGIYSYGRLTLNNSTLRGNHAGSGGGIDNSGTLMLNNATLSGNWASSGGGIDNSGALMLTNTIVAGNTAPSGANILGSFSGTNNLTSGDPLLAPWGNYGGFTRTMPPLPGSPVIDAGLDTGSLPATDQRGFARVVNGIVDIGAAEFQGSDDVALFWSTDWDGDGSPFGVELALGTDPFFTEPWSLGYPVPYPPGSGNGIAFGFNPVATNYTAWVVKRALDLSDTNSFVEIYRYDGPTGITTATNDLTVNITGDSIQIIDNATPKPPAGFYQLVIEPSP